MDYFSRDRDRLNAASQDFIHPPCPFNFIVVEVDIEFCKEVVWEERFDLLDHFPGRILKRFEEREKNFYLLVKQVRLNPVLVAGLRVNDVPGWRSRSY